jgi:hypothetical protein
MSFLNLEILKEKLAKFLRILPYLKLSQTYFLPTRKLKNKINCNSYGLMKIWLNFNHSKVPTIKRLRFSDKRFLI